jgi:antitoxin ParD1/3/4
LDTAGMKLELPSALNRFVAEMVDSGLYESESDVVREGLRLLKEREDLRGSALESLRAELVIGMRDAEAGRVKPFDHRVVERIKANGRKRLAKRTARGG